MRRQKWRQMYYTATCLYDGTVKAAYPIRKPTPKTIKRDKLKIDEDGVSCRWPDAGKELSDVSNETRMRFQDIIANRLNTRRALREIVCPYLLKLQNDLDEVDKKLDHIQQLIKNQTLD